MSNTVVIPDNLYRSYSPVGAAGVWNEIPLHFEEAFEAMDVLEASGVLGDEESGGEAELVLTEEQVAAMAILARFEQTPPYPYLLLLHNKHAPTIDKPAYLFVPALAATPEEPFVPVDEQAADDGLHMTMESGRVIVENTPARHDPVVYDPAAEDNPPAPTQTVRALLYKGTKPIGLHPPVIEALHRLVKTYGIDWDPASLTDIAGMDKDFYHFETVVPAAEVSFIFGEEAHAAPVSALVAAGLRAAICETVRVTRAAPMVRALQENSELLAQYQRALLEGAPDPWRAALEAGARQPQLEG